MWRYIAQRIVLFVPTLLLASLLVFLVMRILPGDVSDVILGTEGGGVSKEKREELRESLGLDDPLPVQYGKWLFSMMDGTFGGHSLSEQRPIQEILRERLPPTMLLAVYTMVVASVVAIPLGTMAAVYQDRWPDYVVRILAVGGLALPAFWVAIMLILGLTNLFNWVPPLIYYYPTEDLSQHFLKMIWPTLILAWYFSSFLVRMTRSSILEVLRQDYIRTAHSKGLGPRTVMRRHALKNGLIPVVTIVGMYLGVVLGGTIIMESVFGIPGMGSQMVDSVTFRDYPVIQSFAMVFIFFVLLLNLLVDISYAYLDPRLRSARAQRSA